MSVTPFVAEWLVPFRLSKDFLKEAMAPVFVPAASTLDTTVAREAVYTLCLRQTPPSTHVPGGLTQTKPGQRAPDPTGIPTMAADSAKGQKPAQQNLHIL